MLVGIRLSPKSILLRSIPFAFSSFKNGLNFTKINLIKLLKAEIIS